jgi:hypothetical protein
MYVKPSSLLDTSVRPAASTARWFQTALLHRDPATAMGALVGVPGVTEPNVPKSHNGL